MNKYRKTLRETLQHILSLPCDHDPDMTNLHAVATAIMKKAMNGDVSAFTALRDSIGEKPTDKLKIGGHLNVAALEKGRERAKEGIKQQDCEKTRAK
ncbi:MAG: hypothetical protein DELT_01717 [Desulfovibrio sp.]